MLSTVEVILNSFVIVLLPLAVYALIVNRPPPEGSLLGRMYRAVPNLTFVSNLFLLALCMSCLGRLGLHFGIIASVHADSVAWITGVPFGLLLVIFLGMLIRAGIKLRRASTAGM